MRRLPGLLTVVALLAGSAAAPAQPAADTAPAPDCPTAGLASGRGRLCVQLAIAGGHPVAEPGAVFVPGGLPSGITRDQVLARLQGLLAAIEPTCAAEVSGARPCLLPSDASLRDCVAGAGAGAQASWVDFWTTVLATCQGDSLLLDRLTGVIGRLGKASPFLLDDAAGGLQSDTGLVRLQVVAFTERVPMQVVGLLPAGEREPALRRALAPLNDALWDGPQIEARLTRHYQGLQLAPQVFADIDAGRIEVLEAAQISGIALPPPAGSDRQRQRLQALYLLLDERDFRRALGRIGDADGVSFGQDLGYPAGSEPFWLDRLALRQKLALNALGLDLQAAPAGTRAVAGMVAAQPMVSAKVVVTGATGASGGQDGAPAVPEAPKTHFIGVELKHRPGQGVSVQGIYRQDMTALPIANLGGGLRVGREQGVRNTGAVELSADYIGFTTLKRRLSFDLGMVEEAAGQRFLDGALRDESRRGRRARLAVEPFGRRDGQRAQLFVERQSVSVTTVDPGHSTRQQDLATWTLGGEWQQERIAAARPWSLKLRPAWTWGRVQHGGPGWRKLGFGLDGRMQFDGGRVLDVSALAEQASSATPVTELPSLGGAESVRGFRRDDGVGARVWKLQTELWTPWPGATDGGGALAGILARLRLAAFVDLGGVQRPAAGATAGARQGAGLGLRLLFDPAVIKLDYGWGHGPTDTRGPRGRLYFSLASDLAL